MGCGSGLRCWALEVRLEGHLDGPLPPHTETRPWAPPCTEASPQITGPGPLGSPGRGQRVGAGGWTERGGAGRRTLGLPHPLLSGDRPRGPPAPPRRIFRGPGPPLPRAATAERGASAVGPGTGPPSSSIRRRHGRCGRPPRPPRPAPGARTRAGADRKCRCHSRVGVWGGGPRSRTQESGEGICLASTLY